MKPNSVTKLVPQDSHKSFYGKAQILDFGDKIVLKSYETEVCSISGDTFHRLWDGWSATTARHINSFRIVNDLAPISKAEWMKLPVERS